MDAQTYRSLLDTYPPIDIFEFFQKVGNKYCQSEKFNPDKYHEWIKSHDVWREFHSHVKSQGFTQGVLDVLRQRGIDVGYKPVTKAKKLRKTIKKLLTGRSWKSEAQLSCRFAYSIAAGRWRPRAARRCVGRFR